MSETKKVIPIVCRQTDFIGEDANKELMLTDGLHICRYTEEYPIIRYENTSLNFEPPEHLNSFVKKICVSTVRNGKKVFIDSNCFMKQAETREEDDFCSVVVYYEDNIGESHLVIQNEIYEFLLKRPNLVVSPEGMLVFYTDKQIFVTLDCFHYYWINTWTIEIDEDTTIDSIYVDENQSLKIVLKAKKMTNILDGEELPCNIVEEEIETVYKLEFEFDFTERIPIKPKATKIE